MVESAIVLGAVDRKKAKEELVHALQFEMKLAKVSRKYEM